MSIGSLDSPSARTLKWTLPTPKELGGKSFHIYTSILVWLLPFGLAAWRRTTERVLLQLANMWAQYMGVIRHELDLSGSIAPRDQLFCISLSPYGCMYAYCGDSSCGNTSVSRV